VLGFLGFVFASTARDLSALEPQLEQTRAEHKRFKAFLAEKRHQETIRDSLVSQIGVIRTVDGDRYVWPHLLDEVTKALPAYTWLVDLGMAAPVAAPQPVQQPAARGAKKAADTVARRRRSTCRSRSRSTGARWTSRPIPVPAPARGLALGGRRHPGLGPDGDREGAPGHRVHHPGDLSPGGFGIHPHGSPQPVGEVRRPWHL
jgi:hypothetical protein